MKDNKKNTNIQDTTDKKHSIVMYVIVAAVLIAITGGICYFAIPQKCGLTKDSGYDASKVLEKAADIVENKKADKEAGEFVAVSETYACGIKRMGKLYAQVQVKAVYDNYDVIYTITFDKDMKVVETYKKIDK